MRGGIIKHIGLILMALIFLLSPAYSSLASATGGGDAGDVDGSDGASSEREKDDAPWATLSTSKARQEDGVSASTYCDAGSAAVFTAICTGQAAPTNLQAPSERYIDITMHTGEYGHFEDGSRERTVTYYRSESFSDVTEPIADDGDYVFAGWSTREEADVVDITPGSAKAYQVGTDLYAVWSDKAYVLYTINQGVWEAPDGTPYQSVLMEYTPGTNFNVLEPHPFEQFYDFAGWANSTIWSIATTYSEETVIDQFWTDVYATWDYNASRIEDEMIVGQEHDVQAGVSIPVYKFTPTESGWYEVYTDGIVDDGSEREGMIRLRDVHDHSLKMEELVDPTIADGNLDMHLYYEMEAGTTYFIRFGEMAGMYLRFNAGVRMADTAMVTFDVNHDDVYFDYGETQSATYEVAVPIGEDIANMRFDNAPELIVDDESISFSAWTDDTLEVHSHLIVRGAMTAYAAYQELVAVHLDYNGGHDPFDVEKTSDVARYRVSDEFETSIDPVYDDPHKAFAGWSTDPNATEPDDSYRDNVDTAESVRRKLDGRTLYAVYTEPVTVTFNTSGGAYMIDDPSVTFYEASYGRGHDFYGMAVMHDDPQVQAIGWVDQNGEYIPVAGEAYGLYTITEDTDFTAVLIYQAIADGNGGCFPGGRGLACSSIQVSRLSYEGPDTKFSYTDMESALGVPMPVEDSGKYFIGYATDPDATEPDIIDGETQLDTLVYVYAIWADDEAWLGDESETTWEQNSEEGLVLTVHRHDDRMTFSGFAGASMDGEEISEDDYVAEEGSLILTLSADYLATLGLGEHQLAVHFDDVNDVNVAITITESTPASDADGGTPATPDTGSNFTKSEMGRISCAASVAIIVFVIAFGTAMCRRKYHK